ncbi:MAG: PorT family protein [Bacteroidaceae bacterium]|nr:PorT family protein [Bacteroidaceae bacterium]
MKKIFCLMFVAFIAMAAQAQITWNAKAGIGFAKCNSDEATKNALVWKAGVGIEKPLSANWSIMPSLEFAMKGSKYEDFGSELSLSYIQIPVLAAYRFHVNNSLNMVLKAGPYVAYAIKGDIDGYDIFEDDEYGEAPGKRLDYGLDLGVDLEYQRYVVGFEYEYGFTSIEKDWETKTSAMYLTIGYKF